MLGISLPDAVLVGTLIVSVLAAWKGGKSGQETKKSDPVSPSSHNTYADIELLANAISLNTGAVVKLTVVMEDEAKRHHLDDEIERELTIRDLSLLAKQLRAGKGGE